MGVAELLEDPVFRAWVRREEAGQTVDWPAFLREYPDQKATVQTARAFLEAIDTPMASPDRHQRDRDFARFERRVGTAAVVPLRRRRRPLRIAAAVAAVLVLAIAAWSLLPTRGEVYATGPGELLKIALPDGTDVVLNANSELRLAPGDWTATERVVTLDGEAYFAVRSDNKKGTPRSFTVETRELSVAVLGTRFNVRDRRGTTRVFLQEGQVRVDWANAELPALRLQPGELVSYEAEKGVPDHQRRADAERHLSWTSGRLIFDRTPLAEALKEIAVIYDIDLVMADTLVRGRELSSSGIPVDNLMVALDILEKALDLRIEQVSKEKYELFAE